MNENLESLIVEGLEALLLCEKERSEPHSRKYFQDLMYKFIRSAKTPPDPEPRAPREGWMRRGPISGLWYTETEAEANSCEGKNKFNDWHTWPDRRVARKGYEVRNPATGIWSLEQHASDYSGWELWESRPIQEPEPEQPRQGYEVKPPFLTYWVSEHQACLNAQREDANDKYNRYWTEWPSWPSKPINDMEPEFKDEDAVLATEKKMAQEVGKAALKEAGVVIQSDMDEGPFLIEVDEKGMVHTIEVSSPTSWKWLDRLGVGFYSVRSIRGPDDGGFDDMEVEPEPVYVGTIKDFEEEPEPKDEAPGLREAADEAAEEMERVGSLLGTGTPIVKATYLLERSLVLRTALSRAEEQNAKVEALVEATEGVLDVCDGCDNSQQADSNIQRMQAAVRAINEAPDAN